MDMRPSQASHRNAGLGIAIAILATAALCATRLANVVLRDATHSTSLIFDRKIDGGLIVESQTWALGASSKIVKSIYSESGELKSRMVAITRGRVSSRTESTITPQGAVVSSP